MKEFSDITNAPYGGKSIQQMFDAVDGKLLKRLWDIALMRKMCLPTPEPVDYVLVPAIGEFEIVFVYANPERASNSLPLTLPPSVWKSTDPEAETKLRVIGDRFVALKERARQLQKELDAGFVEAQQLAEVLLGVLETKTQAELA